MVLWLKYILKLLTKKEKKMNEKDVIRKSKFLSLVLRHKPEEIGLNLDQNGWADIEELLNKSKIISLDMQSLKYIVENNDKKRFAFSDDYLKIRASQGHSIEIDLNYQTQEPPDVLYHGTTDKYLDSIKLNGIQKQKRQHVHLSFDKETATKVGQRHGKPIILKINTKKMYKDKVPFYLSANNVWLVDQVLPEYIEIDN